METEAKQEVEKLREWVDDLRVPKPVEAPEAPAVKVKQPTPLKASAAAEISEGARRTQKIIEAMDLRRQERARLLAQGNSKRVQFQAETMSDQKTAEAQIEVWRKEITEKMTKLQADFDAKSNGRNLELQAIADAIEKLDASLAQLRKQLDAELGKLDPERKGGA